MCLFIDTVKTAQNIDGLIDRWFIEFDQLETARQRGIFFKILFVLFPRRRRHCA
ncbi:Protein of uncharacterised function (DUF3170) [Vibrio cholerae]|nr:Protein of uncharacterised function (DUF3170) [Vibrio cholerae]